VGSVEQVGDRAEEQRTQEELRVVGVPPSPYWRPPGFAAAVVVVDALVCEGAGDALVESLPLRAVQDLSR